MWSHRNILCIGAVFAIAFTPTVSPAQEGRKCSFLVQGLHTDAGDCLYKEADHYYEVVFRSKTYTLVTKTSSGQPRLSLTVFLPQSAVAISAAQSLKHVACLLRYQRPSRNSTGA